MDCDCRDWRDPRSPLTHLKPGAKQMFNYESTSHSNKPIASIVGLKPSLLVIPRAPTSGRIRFTRNFSQDFMRLRSVFSPNAQSTTSDNRSMNSKNEKVVKQGKQEIKNSSPVEQPSLSPHGNTCLTNLFARPEIDISVLILKFWNFYRRFVTGLF